jgi:methylated-DNA-[protein]-cysteine S-methyltransferase
MSANPTWWITHHTPVGELILRASDFGLNRVSVRRARTPLCPSEAPSPAAQRWLEQARDELDEYLAGTRGEFTVALDLGRVEPQHRRVLEHLVEQVGYGRTTTYAAIAAALGMVEDGPRRVGVAMARNPILILVGCHRVLGVGGRLTGYAGGLAMKRWLLDLESRERAPQLVNVRPIVPKGDTAAFGYSAAPGGVWPD